MKNWSQKFKKLFFRSRKPRPRCTNCGYPFFTDEVLIDGLLFKQCIRCRALYSGEPESTGKK